MTTLSIGLNTSKTAPKKPRAPTSPLRNRIFNDSSSASSPEPSTNPTSPPPPKRLKRAPPSNPPTTSLSKSSATSHAPSSDVSAPNLAAQRTQRLISAETASLDPSVYDYDAAYDALHLARETAKNRAKADGDGAPNQARYMGNLLAAAETRKREYERAQDKLVQREREAEGDEFADKEKFVTEAYKAVQEERRNQEAEEKRREEVEKRRRTEAGMKGFYRGVMEDGERRHREEMEVLERVRKGEVTVGDEADGEAVRTAEQIAKEMKGKGVEIALDAEGMVADKRQLLKGGLNVAPPSKSQQKADEQRAKEATNTRPTTQEQRAAWQGARSAKEAQRDRQTRMIEHQLEQAQKQAAQQETQDAEKKLRDAKSGKTEEEIGTAKARYLERKREREEEAAKEKEREKSKR
ncbi:MAG: hypothetical protein M1828_001960 [Chrysothrix sp. TS-e1954]|nr:MAG: hypothetical protein M1828_001960 [Chrysothrix sp. TS-e1954]